MLQTPTAMPKPKPPPPKPAAKPGASKPRMGRPPSDADPMEVMSIRLPGDVVAGLDEWAARLDKKGPGRVTRSSLILHIVRQALEAERAKPADAP